MTACGRCNETISALDCPPLEVANAHVCRDMQFGDGRGVIMGRGLRLWASPRDKPWCSSYPDHEHCFVPGALRAVTISSEAEIVHPSVCLRSDFLALAVKHCACGLVVIATQ